ncbi:type II toxin-antitoxin system death-on-curing family toxin [Kushneria aurantia]|uniref:Type II toxin-antitoxin system death-on-curing family toxin n=1 Tax=Kushneria aurantia TaxID=504092 RepID=A0ABV6G432_9GAMM|nr:type II toxin-antitoxin system death-on-curing family toxin [Kushneria aurantia]
MPKEDEDNQGCPEKFRFLFPRDVIEINQQMLALTPGEHHSVIHQGALESACQRPSLTLYYTQSEDIFSMAAALGEALVQSHPFANANKRTAADAVYRFLDLNGWELTAPSDEVISMYVGLAIHEYDKDEYADWLAQWSRPFIPDNEGDG